MFLMDHEQEQMPKAINKRLPNGKTVPTKFEDMYPFLPSNENSGASSISPIWEAALDKLLLIGIIICILLTNSRNAWGCSLISIPLLLGIISLFLITIFITSSQIFYGFEYISQNFGCYSFENIDKKSVKPLA